MIFPYNGCFTLRSTFTTTVLSVLSETTVPIKIRFGISASLRLGRLSTLSLQRLDAGDIATNQLERPARIKEVRRDIARIKTLQTERTQSAKA